MVNEKWITVNGRRVRILQGGSGKPTLVFIHGLSFSADTWNECCLGYFERKHEVYAIDMPYGPRSRSDHFERESENDYAEHLKAVIDALGVLNPILIGASIGGETVLRYLALSYPASAAVVIGPVGVNRIDLAKISRPVLGIWGSRDNVSPRYNADLLTRFGFKVVYIDGAGHPAYLDKTEEFIKIVEEFLSEVGTAAITDR
ncbi:alpha/beta hydrolase [Caldivirga sp.]|uniref:alpha/beta fold hydrolase n=1 Tax=Caldivirga sp. TaxID=2080243 RepID=UPI0025BABAE6|nr:alpha/beta hydrolase [Caldivirga sp.]